MKKPARPNYSVPALEKGLDVLETMASASRPQTLTELSRSLNRPSSVLFRIVDALEKRGYIAREPVSNAYYLTLKLFELGHTHSPVDQLIQAATYPMRALAADIHESCHLAVLAHGKLVLVAEELSTDRVRLSVELGSPVNPINTASGRLLIAFLSPEARQQFLEVDPDFQALSRPKRKAMEEEFEAIRRQGYNLVESTYRIGLDLAVIVGNPEIGATASLAVPFLAGGRNQGKEAALRPALQKCALHITQSLGMTPVTIHQAAPMPRD
ncbi:MAG: IclR family transcriptional regulator [Bryobacteraceae bacterium]